jgi:hypothetical protein
MDCKHERIRCTNNEYFCLDCGTKLADIQVGFPKLGSTVKPTPKRKTKKESE